MNVRITEQEKIRILNTKSVFEIMQKILLRENYIQRSQEHCWTICLNNDNKILCIELVALGIDNRVHIKPTQVFKMAIYKAASKIILVHNHPSGKMIPSEQDLNFTDRMLKTAQIIELEIIDHLIISETDYISFGELGLIERLKNNGIYEVVTKERKDLEKLLVRTAAKEADMATAKRMLLKGMPHSEIREFTKLTIRELNKLVKSLGK